MDNERLDALFAEAVTIPPSQRGTWLEAHCGDDAPLRRELERLLAADAITEGVLERAPELLAGNLAATAEMPQRFGIWRVLGALGAGGMGEVWLAERDDGQFQQRAAIKQVAFPTPGLLRRFREERQILARLEHPGIARLIDGGVDDRGCPWLAMEYVEGVPINQWLREHALTVRDTIGLVLRICDAVQFAHRSLVVHSDIKPSNILVARGTPKLLDFGIAKVLAQEDTERTATMMQLLTPDYAAPELLAGGAITTSVDVYALGVLLYELLSGSRPYRLSALGGAAALDCANIRPPSSAVDNALRDARARKRMLRGDLDRIVLAAMAREPAKRYASVEALSADLRNWLAGRAINARGHGRGYRLGKFVVRHRIAVALGSAAVLALIATSIFASWQAHQAHLQAMQARIQAGNADAVKDFMVGVFSSTGSGQQAGIGPNARMLLDVGARDMRQRFRNNPEMEAALSAALASSYSGIGAYDKAKTLAQRSLALNAAMHGPGGEQTVQARLDYAEILKDAWAARDAKLQSDAVLALTHDRPGPSSVRAHLIKAEANNIEALYPVETVAEAQRAIAQARQLGSAGWLWQARAWSAIAEADLGQHDNDGAQRALHAAAALYARSRGEQSRETFGARTNLVFLLVHGGHVQEALQIYSRMVAEQRSSIARDDPQWAETLTNYAYILASAGQFKTSREISGEALSALAVAFNMSPEQRDDSLGNLAILARERGDLAGTLEILAQEDRLAPTLDQTAPHAVNILKWKHAGVAAERGDPAGIQQLDALRATAPKLHYSLTFSKQMEWPRAWLAIGSPDLALQRCRELAATPQKADTHASYRQELPLTQGIALVQLGRFPEAEKLLNAVIAAAAGNPEGAMQGTTARLWLGWLQVRAHHPQSGLGDIEQALAWRRDQLGAGSYYSGEALLAHAEALAQLGRGKEALQEQASARNVLDLQLLPSHVLRKRADAPAQLP
ncbi:MAG: serine/threonine protein kinase [Rhodanobacteraceae bacterium]|jgi:serine/threonine-protein kinase|nr:MAG: serine/threonine protein kinase [Rhodanobacteraceae bacterium]